MKDIKSLEKGLRVYLTSKFYPPIPNWVKDVFVDSYKEYWKGNIGRNIKNERDKKQKSRVRYGCNTNDTLCSK